ncbi:hypothetical protein C8R43DRAFT_956877 [Mycena crocata]|nr:hypothetical protein C8R43DRAFT_956877 [Mycena crocata]
MAPKLSDLHFGTSLLPVHRMTSQQSNETHSVLQYASADPLGAVDIFGMVEWFEPGPFLSGGHPQHTVFISSGATDDPIFTETTRVLRDIIVAEQVEANLSGRPFDVLNQWTPPTIHCPAPLTRTDKLTTTPLIAMEHTEACKGTQHPSDVPPPPRRQHTGRFPHKSLLYPFVGRTQNGYCAGQRPQTSSRVGACLAHLPHEILDHILYMFFSPTEGNWMLPMERRSTICRVNRRFRDIAFGAKFRDCIIVFRFTTVRSLKASVHAARQAQCRLTIRVHMEDVDRVQKGGQPGGIPCGEENVVTSVSMWDFFSDILPELAPALGQTHELRITASHAQEVVWAIVLLHDAGLPSTTTLKLEAGIYSPRAVAHARVAAVPTLKTMLMMGVDPSFIGTLVFANLSTLRLSNISSPSEREGATHLLDVLESAPCLSVLQLDDVAAGAVPAGRRVTLPLLTHLHFTFTDHLPLPIVHALHVPRLAHIKVLVHGYSTSFGALVRGCEQMFAHAATVDLGLQARHLPDFRTLLPRLENVECLDVRESVDAVAEVIADFIDQTSMARLRHVPERAAPRDSGARLGFNFRVRRRLWRRE